MTVIETLIEYIQAAENGTADEQQRQKLATAMDGLFKQLQSARINYDLKWYVNQRFIDGDQNLKADHDAGKVVSTTTKKRHSRVINIIKPQIRGIKNSVLKLPVTADFSPDNPRDEKSVQEAKDRSRAWQAIEYALNLRRLLRPVVHDGFVKYSGNLGLLPTADGFLSAHHYDSFDVYADPTAPSFHDGVLMFLATPQNLWKLKQNPDYENMEAVQADNRLAASDYKDSYERMKLGGQGVNKEGDLSTKILRQMFVKLPYALAPVTTTVADPTTGAPVEQPVLNPAMGQPKRELKKLSDGSTRLWIVTATENEIHRVEETRLSGFPIMQYYPERHGNSVYGPAWMDDQRPLSRIVNNLVSTGEEWFTKAKPKLLVPSDSKLKEVTDKTAEVLEYDKRIPGDGIKDYMPQGLPATFFQLIELALRLNADIGGQHEASLGVRPQGVTAARAIEALKAADAESNIAEPIENLGLFYKEVVERAFEYLSQNLTEQKTITYPDGEGFQQVTIIGEAALRDEDGTVKPAPSGVIVIRPSAARITIVPEVAYTEEGKRETVREMYKDGIVDRKTVLKAYKFSNVADIAEEAEREEEKKAQQGAPPPPPVPADKLLNALANLVKSGEPVTIDQLNEAMKQAGLPPMDMTGVPTPQESANIDGTQPIAA